MLMRRSLLLLCVLTVSSFLFAQDATPRRVRISAGVAQAMLQHSVPPVYPPEAKRKGIEGAVVMRAIINTEGAVQDLEPLSGDPDLTDAAMAAVRQWRYRPYLLNGQPVEVETQVTVTFRLARR